MHQTIVYSLDKGFVYFSPARVQGSGLALQSNRETASRPWGGGGGGSNGPYADSLPLSCHFRGGAVGATGHGKLRGGGGVWGPARGGGGVLKTWVMEGESASRARALRPPPCSRLYISGVAGLSGLDA